MYLANDLKRDMSKEAFYVYIRLITKDILAGLYKQNIQINKIVTLSKGGYYPAVALARTLNIRRIYSLGVELYNSTNSKSEYPTVYQTFTEPFLADDVILIVDDIVDTGESMELAKKETRKYGAKNIFTCSLCYKTISSAEAPDFWGIKINEDDIWVDFFWEQEK